MRRQCSGKCPGTPEPGYTIQTFERRGSLVKVTIRGIPADVCPLCHEAFVSRETGRQIDLLLEPFHGKHGRIPALPPAEVTIDFAEATAVLKAA
jgi:YgiT-type zinc finger domain-containing protein